MFGLHGSPPTARRRPGPPGPLSSAALTAAALAVGASASPLAAAAADGAPQTGVAEATTASVEERLAVLTEEVRHLREQMALPETDAQLHSAYGMGPAASRVYRASSGLSLGGYGEFHFEAPLEDKAATGARNVADLYRFVTYVGYKFDDRILMNTEVEIEHATTEPNAEGEAGEVALEFSYLEFLLHRRANLRAGMLLLPMGLTNAMHEPPFYRGNLRPDVERRILPTTWRELGAEVHGELGDLQYTASLVNGLDARKFDAGGIREGRQEGNHALWEDVAGVASLEVARQDRLRAGGSVYYGQSDQNQTFDGQRIDAGTLVYEAHLQVRHGGFEGRALWAGVTQADAGAITRELYPTDGPAASSLLVPRSQWGFYVEAAYDVAPHVGLPATTALLPWVRVEGYDLQAGVPDVPEPGDPSRRRAADPALAVQSLTVGVEMKPTPAVVLKADWTHASNDADTALSDRLRVGAGFVF